MHILGNVRLFEGLTDKELSAIFHLAREKTLEKNQIIFKENSPSDPLLLLMEGEVHIETPPSSGPKTVLARLEPHVVVGELSLLEEAPRPVTAVTVTPTTLLEISRADLFRHFEDHPRVGLTVLKNLGRSFCERWRRSERGYRDPLLWKGVPDD